MEGRLGMSTSTSESFLTIESIGYKEPCAVNPEFDCGSCKWYECGAVLPWGGGSVGDYCKKHNTVVNSLGVCNSWED